MTAERRRRSDGDESRARILDAAVEIAGERGYDGTTIALVSDRCGLRASSIYWHFGNKDGLIAAVIERSFQTWLDAMVLPESGLGVHDRARQLARQMAKALLDNPDFLRLGLMLALERRPSEATARTKFLEVRGIAQERLLASLTRLAPDLPSSTLDTLSLYTLAAADGLFIAAQVDDDRVDLPALFEMHATVLIDLVLRARADTGAARDR